MSASPSFSADSGDEYEETVRKQRAENAALLAELNLQTGGSSIVDPSAAKDRRRDAAAEERKRKRAADSRQKAAVERKRRKEIEQTAGPQRTSARLAGRTPAGAEEDHKRQEEERIELARQREEARKVLHQNHELKALLTSSSADEDEAKKREKKEKLEAALQFVISNPSLYDKSQVKSEGSKGGLGDAEDKKGSGSKEMKELERKMGEMELLAVKKVTPKRIYTAAFHPSTSREIVFTGDKEGHLSVWEPFAPRETAADDEDEEEGAVTGEDGRSWSLRTPHDSSPISCLKIPPADHSSVFYSSYNSTLRKVDLEKGVSEQVFGFADGQDDDDAGDGALLSVFDFQGGSEGQGKVIWCGDHRGGVVRIDLREPTSNGDARPKRGADSGSSNWKRWQLCEKKIGGLSMNPLVPNALAVASLDQSVRIFDVRRLSSGVEPINVIPNNYKAVDPDLLEQMQSTLEEGGAQLGHRQSRQASTSVDFAPDGRHLAAVSYDSVVKVWDIDRDWLRADADIDGLSAAASKKGRSRKSNGVQAATTTTQQQKKGGLMSYFKKEEANDDGPGLSSATIPTDILSSPREISHNTNTGKWITLFRARWSQNPESVPHFTIGSMTRSAQIYSAEGKMLRSLHDSEHVSAIPAVTNLHPGKEARLVTGNASGKCTLWGRRDD